MGAALRLALLPVAKASACAVCFGLGQTDLARGLTIGIFVLVGSTFSILAALVTAILRIERHRALADQAPAHLP